MNIFKRILQYLLCLFGALLFIYGWMYLLSDSNGEPISSYFQLVIPISITVSWAIFQAGIVRYPRLRQQGGIGFYELVILSIQTTLIGFVSFLIQLIMIQLFGINVQL